MFLKQSRVLNKVSIFNTFKKKKSKYYIIETFTFPNITFDKNIKFQLLLLENIWCIILLKHKHRKHDFHMMLPFLVGVNTSAL